MADIHLEPGESLIGQGMMAYWEPVLGSSCDVWRGTIFVTNQKVCFRISWTSHMEFELKLSEIKAIPFEIEQSKKTRDTNPKTLLDVVYAGIMTKEEAEKRLTGSQYAFYSRKLNDVWNKRLQTLPMNGGRK